MKTFKNRHNTEYTVKDGEKEKKIFHVRSTAVSIVLIAKYQNEYYVLINKRGPGCPDNVGKWNLIAGYLDWDETRKETAIREAWEECGVDVDEILLNYKIVKNDLDDAFHVNDEVISNRQNVTHYFGLIFECDKLPETTDKYNEPGETSDIKWINIKDVDNYDFAFNHNEKIKLYVKKSQLFIKY
jgi:8-oxo-dGTP pyrophosphatase MutT (NUDIX family)